MQSNKPADKNFKLELQHFKKVKFSFYRNVKNLVIGRSPTELN